MKAYGAGNDNADSVKAGPGTIYVQEGREPKLVHKLTVAGNSNSNVQQQTYTYISGEDKHFEYDLFKLTGKLV